MTVVGARNLKAMFPEFAQDITPNGIDLKLGALYRINYQTEKCGCVMDKKYKPDYIKVTPVGGEYVLVPDTFYFAEVDRMIEIPVGYIQDYRIRSTFARCGVSLSNGYGDSGFKGTLMFGLINHAPVPVYMGEGERFVQAVTYTTDGSAGTYEGDYQNDKIYNT